MKLRFAIFTSYLLCSILTITQAQSFKQHNDWLTGWTNFDPNTTLYPEATEILPNTITQDTFLSNTKVYSLSGDVYVSSNAKLTIEEGTIIRCDAENPGNLIVSRGSKLIAIGSHLAPIIFTSSKSPKNRKSGDWGGIFIMGNGFVNTTSGENALQGDFLPQFTLYGGVNDYEQTTTMKYIRIEFAGNTSKRKEESSSLTMLGIGFSSLIDHVMVSYSGNDSFSYKGGKNDFRNTISYKAIDDDYQISEGFKGSLQNIMAIRHPYITSPRGSYAIEISGHDKKSGFSDDHVLTDISITNAAFITLSDNSNYIHTTAAIHADNLATIYINSSIISGFSDVVNFDNSYTSLAVVKKNFYMDNSFFNIHGEGAKVGFMPNTGILDILKYNRFTQEFVDVDTLFTNPKSNLIPQFNLKKSENTYMVMQ